MLTPVDLHRFGNSQGPRRPRLEDLPADDEGLVGPEQGPVPNGVSTFAVPDEAGLTGHYWRLAAGTELPDGLAVIADGEDVGGPRPPGHHTLYPAVRMSAQHFVDLVERLPRIRTGKI